jgi:hypothetical protein
VPFEWSADIDQANWWTEVLHPFAQDVGSVIPDLFPAYARLFHPVDEQHGGPRTWAEIAATNGRIAHPEMQLHEIARPLGSTRQPSNISDWCNRARMGCLPLEQLVALVDILTPYTTTPERCWCCVWEGYGQLSGGKAHATLTRRGTAPQYLASLAPPEVADGPRVCVPNRAYLLLAGAVAEIPALFDFLDYQSPNIWWPEDRAWCVSTEIDFAWTYIGGAAEPIEPVLADPRLETLPAKVTDRFTVDSDLLNAALDADG